MQHKRFAWTCAAAGLLAAMSLLGACDPEEDDKTPDPQTDAGTKPDSGTPDSGQPDAGPVDSGVPDAGPPDSGPPDAGEPDAGPPDAGPTTVLPLTVDGTWAPSGYMGDGASGGIVSAPECAATRPGTGKGDCHKFTYTAGGGNWGGVWWQYPESNWGDLPGFEVPEGASVLSFYAWGATGGEVVKFLVGLSTTADGFSLDTGDQTLTAEPKEYTIDVSRVRYRKVVGGFGWVAGGKPTPVVFYVDDIQWR
ncbi:MULTISPECIES: hypothetical protein [Myxococcus]|uniref:Lipoprotein n=1 Tax=Myxococcus llanfairpwllgwyngyllgogerychwyrndrobwllllantysiliogogogochensis TaxID=2590453 RepID=A0A540WY65_9BACT|nr:MULTISPECIES: hypothetical protein [Myxococcus]NTX03215.1 hypothetical protein [Myxococcus sp. CA040A]TQF13880.1 hypothetical protein FJV41_21685 [Myxococcus llanfairpwllgwyngyllgogerychwyrndrobwllllantysiliogogogochensis]